MFRKLIGLEIITCNFDKPPFVKGTHLKRTICLFFHSLIKVWNVLFKKYVLMIGPSYSFRLGVLQVHIREFQLVCLSCKRSLHVNLKN